MLDFKIEDNGFTQALEGISARANVPEDVMKSVGQVMIRSIAQNFLDEGRPSQWQPSRAAMNEGRRTLMKSGRLATSSHVTSVDGKHVEVTTGQGLNYAKFVHFGTQNRLATDKQRRYLWAVVFKNFKFDRSHAQSSPMMLRGLPARRFNLFQDEDVTRISGMLSQYIFFNQKEFGVTIQ